MKNKKQKSKPQEEKTFKPAPLPLRFFQIYVRVFWKLCVIGLLSGLFVVLGGFAAWGAVKLFHFTPFWEALLGIAVFYILVGAPFLSGIAYVIRNFSRQEHAWISDIFTIARKNYWRSVAVGLIDVVLAFMLYFSFAFYSMQAGEMYYLRYVIGMLAILFLWMHYYLYTMLVTFDFSIKALYLNSLLFALSRFVWNILITVIVAVLTVLEYSAVLLFFTNGDTILVLLLVSVLGLSTLFYTVGFWTYPSIKSKIIDRILRRRTMLKKGAAALPDFYTLRDLSYLGYEYFELPFSALEQMSAAEYADFAERFKAFSLQALAVGDIFAVSELKTEDAPLSLHEEGLERAQNLGVGILWMQAPKSWDEKTKQALITVGETAARYHMTLCLMSAATDAAYTEIRMLGQSNIKWAARFLASDLLVDKTWEDGIDQLYYVCLQQPGNPEEQQTLLERLRDLNYEGGVTLYGDTERTEEELRCFDR